MFLIFHGFEEFNGICKKIRYQVKALQDCGVDTRICYLTDEDNHKCRMVDDEVIQDYGTGIPGKIRKRTGLGCIARYVKQHKIELVYVRSDHNTTPFLIHLLYRFRKAGARVVMEIPTYPYDQEYKGLSFGYQRVLFLDKCLRGIMARYIDKFVTFSNHETIFGRPTIRIANGIDFDIVPLKTVIPPTDDALHLIAVATIHPWHGFDRAIRGLIEYYAAGAPEGRIVLHIVGQGVPEVVDGYKHLVSEHAQEENVAFHGPLFGEALDTVFGRSQIGIGSLARHRSGITHLRSLKNREYAARGIPFVYSEIDDDFEDMPYVLKAPADESPLDIAALAHFYRQRSWSPEEIRNSVESILSWRIQMQRVIDNL